MRSKSSTIMDAIITAIERHFFKYHRSPSITDISESVGIARSTVFRYLKEMDEKGLLTYDGETLHTPVTEKANTEFNFAPILGSIACGEPQLDEENFEEYVALPTSIFGVDDFFILHARGESMIEVGIDPGDLVVVRKQNYANEGDIVVALVDNETTLKTYYTDKQTGRPILHPENSSMSDFYPDVLFIQGVADRIIKTVKRR